MQNQLQNQTVTASLVPQRERCTFLARYFGHKSFLLGEMRVYSWLGRLSEDYTGGYWEFYELSNGGFYLAPVGDTSYRIEVDGNGYSGQVSADAAGLIATLFAVSELAATLEDADVCGPLIDRYHHLLEFADSHPEGGAIFQAID